MPRDLRTEPRYFAITPIAAEIGRNNADLVDICTSGARLQVTRSLIAGQEVHFTLRTDGAAIATSATVVWCELAALAMQEEESDRYLCGISFARSLVVLRHIIDELVAAKSLIVIEDIRHAERYRVMAPLTASFGGRGALRVLDLSIRGARILIPQRLDSGTTASLRFSIDGVDTPVDLPATVVWSRPAERKGRFECGLRIVDAEEWLRAVIDELALRDGVVIETDSLRRKFDPFALHPVPGLVPIHR
ncbi:MAG TPA: PilZ domain-containing protein [Thermoanaerobaculia bacterium]